MGLVTFRGKRGDQPRAGASPLAMVRANGIVKLATSAGVATLFLLLLNVRLAGTDWPRVAEAVLGVSPLVWISAGVLTWISFLAVGEYDVILHRVLGSRIPSRMARRAGMAAIAVSQTLGFGLVTGSVMRARLLPGFGLVQASKLTLLVALSFLGAWAIVLAVLAGFRGWIGFWPGLAGGIALMAGLAALAVAPLLRPISAPLPSASAVVGLILLVAVDCLAAAGALYLLCGAPAHMPADGFFLAFLVALGAGLVSGSPAGIGAFEVTFLALLPGGAGAEVLAGIILWRVLYYLIPAGLGGTLALLPPLKGAAERGSRPPGRAAFQGLMRLPGARAEVGVGPQSGHGILPLGRGGWMTARAGGALIGVFDPVGAAPDQSLQALRAMARGEGRSALGYRLSARLASAARARGWAVGLLSYEAMIRPQDFDLGISARSGLRRKLRRAEGAGVSVTEACPTDPRLAADLDRVAGEWRASHGGECGFVMGRHDRGYLAGQRLFVARQDGRLIGFVSFHAGAGEWTLDLMRHERVMPDGAMHLLICEAIRTAAAEAIPRLSLAAAPVLAFERSQGPRGASLVRALRRLGVDTGHGLAQFKGSFAPLWSPRYVVSPSRAGLWLGLWAIRRRINQPGPIITLAHDDLEDNRIAIAGSPWQERPDPQNDRQEEADHVPERPVKAA